MDFLANEHLLFRNRPIYGSGAGHLTSLMLQINNRLYTLGVQCAMTSVSSIISIFTLFFPQASELGGLAVQSSNKQHTWCRGIVLSQRFGLVISWYFPQLGRIGLCALHLKDA